jgi:uncharacterized protein involved in exopolysaccharide biosynthesis
LEPIPHLESIRTLFRICKRRKISVFATTAAALLVSVCISGFSTPAYTARSVIQIDGYTASELEARASLLQSEALVLRVIEDLNLELDHDAGGPPSVIRAFRAHLSVKVVPGTHQLLVQYTDRDPKLAAAVVNHLVDVFADDSATTMLEVIHTSHLTVITKANASSSHGNYRVPLYLAMGGGFGLFFGCCVALLVDAVEASKRKDQGWSLYIHGSSIPRSFRRNSAESVSRAVTKQMGRLIPLRPAADGGTRAMR